MSRNVKNGEPRVESSLFFLCFRTFRAHIVLLQRLIIIFKVYLNRLKGNFVFFKPRPYFWHEIRSSTHREQFGESRRPSEDI